MLAQVLWALFLVLMLYMYVEYSKPYDLNT